MCNDSQGQWYLKNLIKNICFLSFGRRGAPDIHLPGGRPTNEELAYGAYSSKKGQRGVHASASRRIFFNKKGLLLWVITHEREWWISRTDWLTEMWCSLIDHAKISKLLYYTRVPNLKAFCSSEARCLLLESCESTNGNCRTVVSSLKKDRRWTNLT